MSTAPESDAGPIGTAGHPERTAPNRRDAASTVTAVVYGNIVLLATMLSLHPESLAEKGSLGVLTGTGLATYIAHVVSGLLGHRVETGRRSFRADLLHELRLGHPIVTAALVPTGMLAIARTTSLEPSTALLIAAGYVSVRLAILGWTVERAMGEKSSRRVFWAGIALAVAGLLAAVLKIRLAHH